MNNQLEIFKQEKRDEHWVFTYLSENYLISNYGTVLKVDTQKIIPIVLSKNRNHQKHIVKLMINDSLLTYTIAQLVFHSFNKTLPIKGYNVYHINGNPLDNNLTNLQLLTIREIAAKRSGGSQYGTGVQFDKKLKSKPFKAIISINGKNTYLGNYETAEKARTVYQTKKRHLLKQNETT